MTTLHCRCGGEVRIVRLNDQLTALGHVRNPRDKHHPVRLAPTPRSAHGTATTAGEARGTAEGSRGRSEVPDVADPLRFGISPGRRSPRAGSRVPTGTMPVASQPSTGGSVVATHPPALSPESPVGAERHR